MADIDCTCFDGPYRQYDHGSGWHCAGCGAEVPSPDEAQAARDVELLRRALGPQLAAALRPAAAAAPTPLPPDASARAPGRLLSAREVSQLLKIDRSKTLPKLLAAGVLHALPWSHGALRFLEDDVQRLQREGLPGDIAGVGRRPPPLAVGESRRAAHGKAAPEVPEVTSSWARRSRRGAATARAIRSIPLTPKAEH